MSEDMEQAIGATKNNAATEQPSNKQTAPKRHRRGERGNVFFTLFGAVAIVGVLGAGIMSTMRGPLSTMVEINRLEQARSEMRVELGIILTNATDQDTDSLTEPPEPSNTCTNATVTRGCINNDHTDPWGTVYAYCAWNNGTDSDTMGANNLILKGGALATAPAVALISAGPDGVFQNTCSLSTDSPPYVPAQSVAAGDDLVVSLTYTEAVSGSGGIWTAATENVGSTDVATIDRDVDLTGRTSTGFSSQLRLGAASMLLPTRSVDYSGSDTCNGADINLLRINDAAPTLPFVEICNGTNWVAAGSIWTLNGSRIHYTAGNVGIGTGMTAPDDTLDVVGTAQVTSSVVFGGTLSIAGDISDPDTDVTIADGLDLNGVLDVLNGATLQSTLSVAGDISDPDSDVTIADGLDLNGVLDVLNGTTLQSTLSVAGDISDPDSDVTIADGLIVTGTADLQNTISNSSGNNSGDVYVNDTLNAVDFKYNGNDFTPDACAAGKANRWTGTAWQCDAIGDTDGDGDIDGNDTGIDLSNNMLKNLGDVDSSLATTNNLCLVYSSSNTQWEAKSCDSGGLWEEYENGANDIIRLGSTTNMETDNFVFGSTTLDDNTVLTGPTDDDARMWFNKPKGAFRAGKATGTVWDDASVGVFSTAFGLDNTASAAASVAFGITNIASGDVSTAFGQESIASGDGSVVFGYNVIAGSGTADGSPFTFNIGTGMGHLTIAAGLQTATQATKPKVTGDRSAVFFFDGNVVDANSTYNFTQSDKFALIGGEFQIGETQAQGAKKGCIQFNAGTDKLEYADDCLSYTAFSSGTLGLWTDLGGGRIHYGDDGTQQVGIGTDDPQATLDVNGGVRIGTTSGGDTPEFMALNDLRDTSVTAPNDGECLLYNNGASRWEAAACDSSTESLWELSANVVRINEASPAGTDYDDNFVFGSDRLDDYVTDATRDSRMWFNKAKGAFRAGSVTGAQWNDGSVGITSAAFGVDNTASGIGSTVFGGYNTASGAASTTFGTQNTASGDFSIASGAYNAVSGDYSNVYGYNVVAGSGVADGNILFTAVGTGLGHYTFVTGLQSAAQATPPKVTGDRSAVFFFDGNVVDANSTYNFTASDKFAIIGGEFQIGETQAQGAIKGCIRFEPTSNKLQLSHNCSAYTDFDAVGGLWTDNTTHISRENFHILDAGLAAGSTTAGLDGDGTYSFYDPDKAAFRGGTLSGAGPFWQDVNIGDGSFAWGNNVGASGAYSIALGISSFSTTTGSVAIGFANQATNNNYAVAIGSGSVASGENSTAVGTTTVASGQYSVTLGAGATASGVASTALGFTTTAEGDFSTAIGQEVKATGINTLAIGLADQTDTDGDRPVVSGVGSIGIFMDPYDSYDLTATDTLAVIGGEIRIDGDGNTTAGQGCIQFDDTADKLKYSHDCSTYADIGGLWTDNTTHITRGNFHIINTGQTSTTASLDGNGTRSFYDYDKGAMRGGVISGGNTAWTNANIGIGSFAWGENAKASGQNSAAFGGGQSSGQLSTALGASVASGTASLSSGFLSQASGDLSVAFGVGTTASGDGSFTTGAYVYAGSGTADGNSAATVVGAGLGHATFAGGFQTATQATPPKITGDRSAVFFFDGNTVNANSGYNFTQSDKFAIIGGEFQIGETQAQGAIKGCIRFEPTSNKLQLSHNCSAYTDFDAVGGLWTNNTTHITRGQFHIINTGQTSTTAGLDGDGARAFYDPDKGAMRGGHIVTADDAWQAVNMGIDSFGWGRNVEVKGDYSHALGLFNSVSGNRAVGIGETINITGNRSVAIGNGVTITSERGVGIGTDSTVNGVRSVSIGDALVTSGTRSIALGVRVSAGSGTAGDTTGDGSLAVGLQTTTHATIPKVTGKRSAVFFFDGSVLDSNSTYDFTANDKFAIIGGELQIGERQNQGAAKGCIRFNAGTDALQYSDDCTTYVTFNSLTSDRRLKEDIIPLNQRGSMLEQISKINTYSYKLKNKENAYTQFGVVAQELEEIFPELVNTEQDEIGSKSVRYGELIAPLIEATKELRAENEALKTEIAAIKDAQTATTQALQNLNGQVDLLNTIAAERAGQATLMPLALLLLGLCGGFGLAVLYQRQKA